MAITQKERSVVSLVEGSHDDLRVVRLDGDQFLLTAQQAVDACSKASESVRFQNQFRDLLEDLYSWIEIHKEKISSAHITIDQDGILLLIVQRSIPTDFELEDKLVELDLEIANKQAFELVPFNTLLVPPVDSEVLHSFRSSGKLRGL